MGKHPKSTSFRSLNGDWRFHFVPEPSQRPTDFYKEDYDVSTGQRFRFLQLGNAEVDRPIYANVEYPHANIPPFIDARRGFNDGGRDIMVLIQ